MSTKTIYMRRDDTNEILIADKQDLEYFLYVKEEHDYILKDHDIAPVSHDNFIGMWEYVGFTLEKIE